MWGVWVLDMACVGGWFGEAVHIWGNQVRELSWIPSAKAIFTSQTLKP